MVYSQISPSAFSASQDFERSRPIRTPYSPDGARAGPTARAREDTPRAARATGDACVDVTRVYPGRDAPTFASARRRGAGEAARQRVSLRRRKEEWWDLERRDSHGQGQKRRRRDARAGSEAPKARCTGRVRSAGGAMHGQGQKRRRRDSHGQGQKRRRRDARAGSEA